MLFIEVDNEDTTVDDMQRICRHILDRDEIVEQLSEKQLTDIKEILKPSMSADKNENKKRQYWQDLLENFQVRDSKGDVLRFYHEPKTGYLYFGNQEGLETVVKMLEKPKELK